MKKIEDKYLKFFLVGAALLLFNKVLNNLSSLADLFSSVWSALLPVVLAVIIVFFAYGPSCFFENIFKKRKTDFVKKHARAFSLLIIYTILITCISVLIRFLLPAIYTNLMILINNLPEYLSTLEVWIKNFVGDYQIDIIGTVKNTLLNLLNINNIKSSFNAISSFFSSVFSIFTAIILSVYILADRENVFRVCSKIARLLLKEHYTKIQALFEKTASLFYSYFIGLATDALIVGIITTVFLHIIRSPYAILLGLIVCVGNLIPVFGSIIASVIIYLLSAVSYGPITAIWILVFQLVLGQIDGNYIQPKIISRSVHLSPIWIILSVIVFGNLFGAVGMVIGTPIVASAEMVITSLKSDKNEVS